MSVQIKSTMILAPLPLTERGFGIHLGGTTKIIPRIVYCSQNLIIQRELEDLTRCTICSEHSVKTNVAKYSPNGEWVCSGDESGKCLVWAHQSFVVKNTIEVGRKVQDISWDSDGQRIFAVGSGKDDKAKVFPWNSNNKLGDISGAQKGYLSCDFKPTRPYRLIASAEDFAVYYYKGPPFVFETYDKTHKNFVNCTRFSPDGNYYVSVGSDKQIVAFDGKSGAKIKDIDGKDNHHKGTIYEISWSPDGKHFLTASADKTCKVWNFDAGEVVHTFKFGDNADVPDMQVSCLWLENWILSLSLSGKLNFLKLGQERPTKVITGHRKPIQDMALDRTNQYLYTCDADSRVVRTECKSGDAEDFVGDPHNGTLIKYIRLTCDNKFIYTVGVDDTFARSSVENLKLSEKVVKIDGAARGLAVGYRNADLAIIATHKNKLIFFKQDEINKELEVGFTPTVVALSFDDKIAAVGGEDNAIHLISVDDYKETNAIVSEHIRGNITALAFSPDGKYLASADRNRHIWVWDLNNLKEPKNLKKSYQYHNGVPCCLEWSPDSKWLISGGHDNNIYLWLEASNGRDENVHFDNAFHQSIRQVSFVDNTQLVGVSADCTIRFFEIVKQ